MKYRSFFLIMVLLVLISSLSGLISPVLLQFWSLSGTALSGSNIRLLVLIMLFVCLFQLSLSFFQQTFAKDFNKRNALHYLNLYFHMRYDAINRIGAAALLDRILTIVNAAYDYMTGPAITRWANGITIFFCLILIGLQNIFVGALLFLMIPLNYIGYRLLNRELAKRSLQLSKTCSEAWQVMLSRCQQVDYFKQCPDCANLLTELDAPLEKNYRATMDVNVYARMSSQLISGLNDIIQTLTMLLVIHNVINTGMQFSGIAVFSVLLPIYVSNVKAFTNTNLQRTQYKAAVSLAQEMEDELEKDGTEDLSEITDITFSCDALLIGENKIPGPFCASFHKGDVVWVKGHSGCGKSSLMKLLCKFRLQPGLLVNGLDIAEYRNDQIRQRVCYLSQNVPIIQGTIAENLFFNLMPDQDRLREFEQEPLLQTILKNHCLHDPVDEGGANLSGGEKQKIALSRVIDSHPDVWILDEITSNIDQQSASEILGRIASKKEESILFIISHDDLPLPYVTHIWDLESHSVEKIG